MWRRTWFNLIADAFCSWNAIHLIEPFLRYEHLLSNLRSFSNFLFLRYSYNLVFFIFRQLDNGPSVSFFPFFLHFDYVFVLVWVLAHKLLDRGFYFGIKALNLCVMSSHTKSQLFSFAGLYLLRLSINRCAMQHMIIYFLSSNRKSSYERFVENLSLSHTQRRMC